MNAPPEVRRVVDFLRTKSGMKVRPGVVNGQRADYFKGSAAVKAVLSPEYAKLKGVPKVTTEEEAEKMLHNLLPFAFFLRVERGDKPSRKDERRVLQVNQMQMFEKDMYYAWFYEGSQLLMKLAGLGMVVVMLAAVMFPLWPHFLRLGVWYLSVGILGLFGLLMVIAVLRLIFWVISIVVLPPGIWIFPNLFADVGVVRARLTLFFRSNPSSRSGHGTCRRPKSRGARKPRKPRRPSASRKRRWGPRQPRQPRRRRRLPPARPKRPFRISTSYSTPFLLVGSGSKPLARPISSCFFMDHRNTRRSTGVTSSTFSTANKSGYRCTAAGTARGTTASSAKRTPMPVCTAWGKCCVCFGNVPH